MTKTGMPKVDAGGEGGGASDGCGGGVHRVELVRAITSVQNHPSAGVLHRKTSGVKFNRNRIFSSKLTNRNETFN
jgi:hypothetical protein